MTCVAGLVSDGNVYMCSDRGVSDSDSIVSMATPKISRIPLGNDSILIGYAGSGGMGQLVSMIDIPPLIDDSLRWLRTLFAPTIIKARENMAGRSEDEASLLIAIHNSLYEMDTSDYSCYKVEYSAIGSGGSLALGSLYTTRTWTSGKRRVEEAVSAAISHSPTCYGPSDTFIL